MRKYILAFSFLFLINLNAQEVLDKIVAVVGDEIILKSELDYQAAYRAAQRNLNPNDEKIRRQILNEEIEKKLLYAQAELDSIEISDEEVEGQLDYQLNYFTQQYGSQERLEAAYGMSIERIRRELRDETRKNLMAQTVQNQKFGMIDVSRKEVEDFYETYQDSLGLIPEKFEIAHIFINPKANERVTKKAKDFAQSLLDSIRAGSDFGKLAKSYSDDPGSAKLGGNLGFVKRGVFFPEFESAAFALQENEISEVIKSPVGFHIIQLLERRGESINTRHILIKIKNDDDADLESITFLSDIRDSIQNGTNTFAYYARKFSDDKETAKFGGKLGKFEVGQLDKPLLDQVYKLKAGEVGFPKRLNLDNNEYGFHIVKLINRTPEHLPSLEGDYEDIKRLVIFDKRQKLYVKWMEELKSKIFWEIRI
ncbi:MAG: parvulin peptidyl-prolyl isomerase [Ignavibacteriae bacterium]|nr:parvulin peptidyl-prolyl isomerase [Ignavibacteriota bacterium]NOG97643.1 parvulin peptidyl-prolyl isomerase [Ignavibacteriota bacterium]